MAKKSCIHRQKKRQELVERYAERRAELVKIIKSQDASWEDKEAAYKKIAAMPRDASKVRLHNRCSITGRPKGYYRKFGVSRLVFRRLAHAGELPGVRKSSW